MRVIDRTENRELIRALSMAPIFASLGRQELDFIADHCALYMFDPGEHIYCAGSVQAELFVIVNGSVCIYRTREEQDEEAVARFVPGESFGELGLLSEEPREELARAEEASRVLIFPRRNMRFTEILASRPGIASRLLRKLMEAAASRLRHANHLIKQNSPWIRELQRQVYTDPLTGLPNRTFLEEKLGTFFSPGPCSLLMFKPDNFKQINDAFGHEAGDEGIRQIGRLLSRATLPEEQIARFMGNEYALICPGTDLEAAAERAREIRDLLCNLSYEYQGKPDNIVVTASAGLAVYPRHADNPEKLIEKAHSLALQGRTLGGRQLLIASTEEKQTL